MRHERSTTDLGRLLAECAEPDWDAYGADPVDVRAVQWARRFIQSLPEDLPSPSVSADPDGEVSLSWEGDRKSNFSVSIGPTGWLSYAGLVSPGELPAGATEFAEPLPSVVLEYIRRLPNARAAGE
jgi:hypothetical protein